MPGTVLQHRRGTATEAANAVLQLAEMGYDPAGPRMRVHDGITPGGAPLALVSDFLMRTPKWCGTSTGTANVQMLAPSEAFTGLAAGLAARFVAGQTNTSAATLALNALPARPIIRSDGSALRAGDITANALIEVVYDGTSFRILADRSYAELLPVIKTSFAEAEWQDTYVISGTGVYIASADLAVPTGTRRIDVSGTADMVGNAAALSAAYVRPDLVASDGSLIVTGRANFARLSSTGQTGSPAQTLAFGSRFRRDTPTPAGAKIRFSVYATGSGSSTLYRLLTGATFIGE